MIVFYKYKDHSLLHLILSPFLFFTSIRSRALLILFFFSKDFKILNSSSLFIMSTPNTQIIPQIIINQPTHIDRRVSCKLADNNSIFWRFEVYKIVKNLGLIGFLTGSISAPPSTITSEGGTTKINPNYRRWHMQDQLLLGWLRSMILEPVLARFMHCQTSVTLWASLSQFYSKPSRGHIMELQEQLLNLQRGSESCSAYFEKMKSMADELAALGVPISDEALQIIISGKLGPEFDCFVEAVASLPNPPSLTVFHNLLHSYASLHCSQPEALNTSHNLDPVALHATTQGQNDGRHTIQPSLVPTPSSVPHGTYPGPRGRGHGPSFPGQQPQQVPQPSYRSSGVGFIGGQHTIQPSLVPTPSSVPHGTYPGPMGEGHGPSFPAQPTQQVPPPHPSSRVGLIGGQHTIQPSLVPTPSSAPHGTYPVPVSRAHGQSFPATAPQQVPRPACTSAPPQVIVVLTDSSSSSNDGPIHDNSVSSFAP
jgi:gag-polypeptide of LTR copia-type